MATDWYKKHSQHYVAVDCVIFGYTNKELSLLLYPRSYEPSKGDWSLLGGFVSPKESADEAAARVLQQTTGLQQIFMEQVAAFSDPNREQVARVISIGYYALIRIDEHDEEKVREYGAEWFPLCSRPSLVFDHDDIVANALVKLQQKAGYELVGSSLLPARFTLTQLRYLYEAIFQRTFDPGNFRKKILSLDVLKRWDEKDLSESKRGAYYYSYIPEKLEQRDIIRIIKN